MPVRLIPTRLQRRLQTRPVQGRLPMPCAQKPAFCEHPSFARSASAKFRRVVHEQNGYGSCDIVT